MTMGGGAMDGGVVGVNTRINLDTDHISTTFAQYQANVFNGKRVGNGFRLVGAPVNAGPAAGGGAREVVGIAGFFVSSSSTNAYYPDKDPWCAEYYGVWNKAGQCARPETPGTAYSSAL